MDIYYIYILTNKNHTVLYVDRSKQLKDRLKQHRNNNLKTFTGRYDVDKLVYFETTKVCKQLHKKRKTNKKVELRMEN